MGEEMLKNSKLSIDIAINGDRVRGNRLIRHAQSANYSNNSGATNSTNLGSLEAIGAFIGTVAAGASVAKAVEGYGVKIDIRNEICAELNWAGHAVQSHGTVQTPCRDPFGRRGGVLIQRKL